MPIVINLNEVFPNTSHSFKSTVFERTLNIRPNNTAVFYQNDTVTHQRRLAPSDYHKDRSAIGAIHLVEMNAPY